MIIFEGENTTECKSKAMSRNNKMFVYIYLGLFLSLSPTFLILLLLNIEKEFSAKMLFTSILFLPLALGMAKNLNKRLDKVVWKRKIEFDNNKIIFTNYINSLNVTKNEWNISSIRKISDYGLYYEVSIGKQRLICEKSLLVVGTIAEFEDRFKNNINKKK